MKKAKKKKSTWRNNYDRVWPPTISKKKLEFYLMRKKVLEERFGNDEKIPLEERKKPIQDIELITTHTLLRKKYIRVIEPNKKDRIIDNFLNKQTEINNNL